jgi:biotin synthase
MSPEEILNEVISADLPRLFVLADSMRREKRGERVDLCAIVNAKSGNCPEDCAYCAQSLRHRTDIETFPLLEKEEILRRAREARSWGARRFCIVTSGRKPTPDELGRIAETVSEIRILGLLPCATLGILAPDELRLLKDAGLERYHHNIETSERFFPRICSTHTYSDKIRTIESVRKAGLSLCSGGIFGLGETWEDRLQMARTLRELDPDSVPINFLIPINGTPLGERPMLPPIEALRIVSLFRLMLPEKEIRICGGRHQTLGEFNSMVFLAGADGLLIGNYLTRQGRGVEDDLRLIAGSGLEIIS